jgi:TPR repeat protein
MKTREVNLWLSDDCLAMSIASRIEAGLSEQCELSPGDGECKGETSACSFVSTVDGGVGLDVRGIHEVNWNCSRTEMAMRGAAAFISATARAFACSSAFVCAQGLAANADPFPARQTQSILVAQAATPEPILTPRPTSAAAQTECDKLAASPVPLAPAAAKPPIDWAHAIEVCAAEVKADPSTARLQYELGRTYFQTKNYLEAVRHYRIAADAGYGQAISDLGVAYVRGQGAIKNDQTAFELFNKAAQMGNANAMQNVGSMYAAGFFVKQDQSKALEWYEKSIEAGNAGALGAAGVVYFNGDGGAPDYKVAAQYFQQAADLGDGYSLKFLAIMYERGLLGPVDHEKAGALRAKAQHVDPESQDPNVPQPRQVQAQKPRHTGSGGGNRNGGGGGSDSGCADTQFCTGTVHVSRWRGMATHLPRCWPFCTVN